MSWGNFRASLKIAVQSPCSTWNLAKIHDGRSYNRTSCSDHRKYSSGRLYPGSPEEFVEVLKTLFFSVSFSVQDYVVILQSSKQKCHFIHSISVLFTMKLLGWNIHGEKFLSDFLSLCDTFLFWRCDIELILPTQQHQLAKVVMVFHQRYVSITHSTRWNFRKLHSSKGHSESSIGPKESPCTSAYFIWLTRMNRRYRDKHRDKKFPS